MARSSPTLPETRMKGMSGYCFEAICNAVVPSKDDSAQSEKMISVPPCSSAATKSSWVCTCDRTSDVPGLQGGLNQRGIVWIILQVQDVERGFHWQPPSFPGK